MTTPSTTLDEHTAPALHPGEMAVGNYTDDAGHDGVQLHSPGGEVVGLSLHNPSWLVSHRGFVLAARELPQSHLAVLARTADGFTVVDDQPTGGADACHLAPSPDGSLVAVANYTSGAVTLFRLSDRGALDHLDLLPFTGNGPVAGRQDSPHAHQVTWLDDEHLLVCDLGTDRLHVLAVGDGALQLAGSITLPQGFGPRHLVLRRAAGAAGAQDVEVALCGELSGHVVSLRHTGSDWTTGWEQVDLVDGTRTPGANQPSGLRLFSAGDQADELVLGNRRTNTLALLRWGHDGRLELVSEDDCGGVEPRDVVVHDDQVWVANQTSGNLARLRRTGAGFELAESLPAPKPASILFG